MSFALRARASVDRLAQHFGHGATLTLRRSHTLTNARDASNVTALAVRGTTAAGASSINLDATDLARGGIFPIGFTFTIAGDGTTYTTTNAVEVGASGRLDSVEFSPVLAAEATDDAVVTITATEVDYTFTATRRHLFEDETTERLSTKDWHFLVSSVGAAVEIDLRTDALVFDGQALDVIDAAPIEPGTERAGYVVRAAA